MLSHCFRIADAPQKFAEHHQSTKRSHRPLGLTQFHFLPAPKRGNFPVHCFVLLGVSSNQLKHYRVRVEQCYLISGFRLNSARRGGGLDHGDPEEIRRPIAEESLLQRAAVGPPATKEILSMISRFPAGTAERLQFGLAADAVEPPTPLNWADLLRLRLTVLVSRNHHPDGILGGGTAGRTLKSCLRPSGFTRLAL